MRAAATPTYSRGAQARVVRLLARLLERAPAMAELVRAQDVARLFNMIVSKCPSRNEGWQVAVAGAMRTGFATGLSKPTIQHIQERGLLRQNLAALQGSTTAALTPAATAAALCAVVECVRQSSRISHVLLDELRTCQGYTFLADFLAGVAERWAGSGGTPPPAALKAFDEIVCSVGELSFCGFVDIKPNPQLAANGHQLPRFKLPAPRGDGSSVRNLPAFFVLHSAFLGISAPQFASRVLDEVVAIFAKDPANYFICEPQHTVALFLEMLPTMVQRGRPPRAPGDPSDGAPP